MDMDFNKNLELLKNHRDKVLEAGCLDQSKSNEYWFQLIYFSKNLCDKYYYCLYYYPNYQTGKYAWGKGDGGVIPFEEILELVIEEHKQKLLFNLDLFV